MALLYGACTAPQTQQETLSDTARLAEDMRGEDAPNTGYSCESLDGSVENFRITTFVPLHLCACGIRLSVTEEDGQTTYEVYRGAATRSRTDDTRLISSRTDRLERAYERSSGRWQRLSQDRFDEEEDNFTGILELFDGTLFRLTERCMTELLYETASSEERRAYIRQHYGR